jgi:hypothetical protein
MGASRCLGSSGDNRRESKRLTQLLGFLLSCSPAKSAYSHLESLTGSLGFGHWDLIGFGRRPFSASPHYDFFSRGERPWGSRNAGKCL